MRPSIKRLPAARSTLCSIREVSHREKTHSLTTQLYIFFIKSFDDFFHLYSLPDFGSGSKVE